MSVRRRNHSSAPLAQLSRRQTETVLNRLRAVLRSGADGEVVEMGCYKGDTSLALQRALAGSGKRLYLYDSFAGLPAKGPADASPAGEQFRAGELAASKAELLVRLKKAGLPMPTVIKGWFEELTPEQLPERICFGLLDGDFYGSIAASLRLVGPRMSSGSSLVIDDYQNEALPGVARAVNRWLTARRAKLSVVQGMAVVEF